jgi:sec-independent protein translocase protein TatA
MIPLALTGPTELWIVLAIVIVIFGARKLPELARAMGSSITQFKRGLKEEPDQLEGGTGEGDGENKEEG